MCFVLKPARRLRVSSSEPPADSVPLSEDGEFVPSSEYDALRDAYLKLRADLLKIVDNKETDDAYKSSRVKHMVDYSNLRESVK